MDALSWSLILAALGVALGHTVLGPDHYGPLAMMASARGWRRSSTAAMAALFGLGHVLSSLALCAVALVAGWAVGWVERIESGRADVAAWALLGIGLAYTVWGARKAIRFRGGLAVHSHGHDAHVHAHGDHVHEHESREAPGTRAGFWALFAVFILGPCEPLIPLFLLPASRGEIRLALVTAAVFGAVTIAAMVALTLLCAAGAARVLRDPAVRWGHALTGGVIAASALAILFTGA